MRLDPCPSCRIDPEVVRFPEGNCVAVECQICGRQGEAIGMGHPTPITECVLQWIPLIQLTCLCVLLVIVSLSFLTII